MRKTLALLLWLSTPAFAQSMLDRPPNISGDWVAYSGTVQFNFLHRFTRSGAPERKVSNFPTFLMGIGLPQRTMIGFTYATNSTLSPRYPNEWEFFVRHVLVSESEGGPIDLGGQVGYNIASDGVDGEVSIARHVGPLRLIGVTRVVANPYSAGKTQLAVGGGGTIKVSRFMALAGDWVTITNPEAGKGEKAAWSAGVHLAIPNTPHTLSIQATNTNTGTLQGLSRGEGRVRYGFEFTIPLTLARYFAKTRPPAPAPVDSAAVVAPAASRPSVPPPVAVAAAPAAVDTAPAPAAPAAPAAPVAKDSAINERPPAATASAPTAPAAAPSPPPASRVIRATMKGLNFLPKRVEIPVGATLVWKNEDPLAHTVTAADRSFDSGLIQAGGTWRRLFSKPGTYQINCTPHPFMKTTVVVKAEP